MTETTRTIQVDYLARVEGEGSLTVRLVDGKAAEARLSIFEPPRFFEALLRGRALTEAPDITSRICGICPVAYLVAACNAMEDATGLRPPEGVRALRRLLYCGEWIESHALHVFLLHAPDFLGYPDALAMAKDHKPWVQRGLSLKKAGNRIMAAVGGREVHPVNVRVGGFYRAPDAAALAALLPELRAAAADAAAAVEWIAGTFTFPDVTRDWELVALVAPDRYAIEDGTIASSRGLRAPLRDYDACFVEEHAGWSNALRSHRVGGGAYLCGPLARFHLSFEQLRPEVRALAAKVGVVPPMSNPFKSIVVRMLEVLEALLEAIHLIETYAPPVPSFLAPTLASTAATRVGHGATEAPRGLIYQRYAVDAAGLIADAKIVAPTSQNQAAIEEDLLAIAGDLASLPLPEATVRAEQAVRNHDPCISCATHFLTLKIEGA